MVTEYIPKIVVQFGARRVKIPSPKKAEFQLSKARNPWPQPEIVKVRVSEPDLSSIEKNRVDSVFSDSWIGSGSQIVSETESRFASLFGYKRALLVSNGSNALMLSLRAAGVGEGDEVITANLSYAATASSIVNVGATPVLVDVESDSWQLSLSEARNAITPRSKAIILPHSYGVAGDLLGFRKLCDEFNLVFIEDCAEAIGAVSQSVLVGTLADFATFSFFPNKLVTSGEGGMVVTGKDQFFERARLLRGQGMDPDSRYWFLEPGYNFRISGLQAAVLLGQLDRYEHLYDSRLACMEKWSDSLGSLVAPPTVLSNSRMSPWIFTFALRVGGFEKVLGVARELADLGVETRPVFYPLDSMPAFERYRRTSNPNSYELASKGMSLPTHGNVPGDLYDTVANIIATSVDQQ